MSSKPNLGRPWAAFCCLLGLLALPAAAAFPEPWLAAPLPKVSTLWLTADDKQQIQQLLGVPYQGLRIRYWRGATDSAWVLEAIGKERPITFGVVVRQQAIVAFEVLAYRESRGGEIRHAPFRAQFEQAHLAPDGRLDRTIDGITGATMSVDASRNMARLALWLDARVRRP